MPDAVCALTAAQTAAVRRRTAARARRSGEPDCRRLSIFALLKKVAPGSLIFQRELATLVS